jgi:hypothetical protein
VFTFDPNYYRQKKKRSAHLPDHSTFAQVPAPRFGSPNRFINSNITNPISDIRAPRKTSIDRARESFQHINFMTSRREPFKDLRNQKRANIDVRRRSIRVRTLHGDYVIARLLRSIRRFNVRSKLPKCRAKSRVCKTATELTPGAASLTPFPADALDETSARS